MGKNSVHSMDTQPIEKRKLRIGYLMQADAVDMSTVSGPQLHVEAVIRGLKKQGHEVRLVAIQNGQTLWTDDLIHWQPVAPGFSGSGLFRFVESIVRGVQSRLHLPFFRLFDSYRFSDACVFALHDADILYERDGTISYGGLIASWRLGIPIILEINGDLIEEWKQLGMQWTKLQEKVIHYITRQLYRHATHMIAVGETIRRIIIERWGLDPARVSVVTNGADIDLFLNSEEDTSSDNPAVIDQGPVISFSGSFQPWHGVDFIIEAFHCFLKVRPDAVLMLVGDGPLRQAAEMQAQTFSMAERVIFPGKVSHEKVIELLRITDIAVIYHRAAAAEIVETPLKLFEYMAAGKAIVAPDYANMRRILTDRVNAILIPPDNPDALAETLLELIADSQLRKRIGQAARQEALAKHSWHRTVNEIETIMFGLLK